VIPRTAGATLAFLVFLSAAVSAFGPIFAVILCVPPYVTYLLGKLPGERAKALHNHMAGAIGTVIGAAICVLVIWGFLIGGGSCTGWGCG
jgi:hypothetical protein